MSQNTEPTFVSSWNEWDPLRHVIVGRADGTCIPATEPALDAKVPEDSDMRGQFGPRPKDTIDKANELLDAFASKLESRGIKVDQRQSTLIKLLPHLIGSPRQCSAACLQEMFY